MGGTTETADNGMEREKWVEMFEQGFEYGCMEGHELEDFIDEHERTDAEIEALEAGYEVGGEWFPGAEIDVQQRANSAYDRSGYAAGLSQWTQDTEAEQ